MRDFERPSGRLRGLSFHARLVYSVFLVFTLAALGITAWLADEMVGADLSSVHSYYAGEESTEAQPSPVGGPSLDLPEDAVIRTPPMPRRNEGKSSAGSISAGAGPPAAWFSRWTTHMPPK